MKKLTKKSKEVETKTPKKLIKKKENKMDTLKSQASNNTTVIKKEGRNETTIKEGAYKNSIKHPPNVIGLSKGITKNLENYESLRVECWLSTTVEDFTLESINSTINELSEIIDEVIYEEVLKTVEE